MGVHSYAGPKADAGETLRSPARDQVVSRAAGGPTSGRRGSSKSSHHGSVRCTHLARVFHTATTPHIPWHIHSLLVIARSAAPKSLVHGSRSTTLARPFVVLHWLQ